MTFIYVVFIACICYYVVCGFYIVGDCLYLVVWIVLFVVIDILVAGLSGAGWIWCFGLAL